MGLMAPVVRQAHRLNRTNAEASHRKPIRNRDCQRRAQDKLSILRFNTRRGYGKALPASSKRSSKGSMQILTILF
jgi:hypothetical protein